MLDFCYGYGMMLIMKERTTYEVKYIDAKHPTMTYIGSMRQYNKALKQGEVMAGSDAYKRPVIPFNLMAEISGIAHNETSWNDLHPWMKI